MSHRMVPQGPRISWLSVMPLRDNNLAGPAGCGPGPVRGGYYEQSGQTCAGRSLSNQRPHWEHCQD